MGGASDDANDKQLPCLWTDGTPSSIQALSLPAGFQMAGWVTGMNDSDDAVGAAESSSYVMRAALWPYGQSPVNLGVLPGASWSSASDINNAGQIVGGSGGHAFIYQNDQMTDLNDLIAINNTGWNLQWASAINDLGQIVGSGQHNNETHAFLLSPVRLVDAQAFQPALDTSGAPYLTQPITNRVDSSFDRIGSLTDGASLVIVQLAAPGVDETGWTVTLTDPNDPSAGPEALGSLWHSDSTYTTLPPLPATLTSAGTVTVTLNANESVIFYRAAPSWAYGSGAKTTNIEIQVFDQNNNLAVIVPFTLYKPPLVLVHGLFGTPGGWAVFTNNILPNAGISVDTFTADYATNNTAGFDTIFRAVPKAISNAIARCHYDKVAATRVDVVAHSMGTDATRWYMTPSSALLGGDRGANIVTPLKFKTTPINTSRVPQDEFRRADNFDLGDVRRLITLGGVHTGTSITWLGIKIVNKALQNKLEPWHDLRKTITHVELRFGFQAIPLTDTVEPGNSGMALVDLTAFGTHPFPEGTAPPQSQALSGLAPIPVPYAPIEGRGVDPDFFGTVEEVFLTTLASVVVIGGTLPSDLLPARSDTCVPSLSARNLNPVNDALIASNTFHWELTESARVGSIMTNLLGADENFFIQP